MQPPAIASAVQRLVRPQVPLPCVNGPHPSFWVLSLGESTPSPDSTTCCLWPPLSEGYAKQGTSSQLGFCKGDTTPVGAEQAQVHWPPCTPPGSLLSYKGIDCL